MLLSNKTVFLLESGFGLDPWLLYLSPKVICSTGCPCLPTGSSTPAHGPESHIISLCPEMLQKSQGPANHSPAHVPEASKPSPPCCLKLCQHPHFFTPMLFLHQAQEGLRLACLVMVLFQTWVSQAQTFGMDINSGTKLSLDLALHLFYCRVPQFLSSVGDWCERETWHWHCCCLWNTRLCRVL